MELAILDTDTLSEVFKGKAPKVVRRAAAYLREHNQFAFSSFTRYEVLRGLKERAPRGSLLGSRLFVSTRCSCPSRTPSWIVLRTSGSRPEIAAFRPVTQILSLPRRRQSTCGLWSPEIPPTSLGLQAWRWRIGGANRGSYGWLLWPPAPVAPLTWAGRPAAFAGRLRIEVD